MGLGVEDARGGVDGEPAEGPPAGAGDADGVEGWLERGAERPPAERVVAACCDRSERVERGAQAFAVELEVPGELLEARAPPPGAGQDDVGKERVRGARRGG